MILLCGIESEVPLELVRRRATALGEHVVIWNQRHFVHLDLEWEPTRAEHGLLRIGPNSYRLDEFSGVFLRTLSETMLPELRGLPPQDPTLRRCADLHARLYAWCELTPGVVMNRVSAMGSNASKPYQAEIIRAHGFEVPATLITNDPNEVLTFRDHHGSVLYKSISGTRSIVTLLEDDDMGLLKRIMWCPTQFQARVDGTDIRVHVVGADIFATEITTTGVDYRYAACAPAGWTRCRATRISDLIAERCVRLAADLGLSLAGIDLRRTPDNRYVCFEVNPSPGFSYYEHATDQPIAAAIACVLAGRPPASVD